MLEIHLVYFKKAGSFDIVLMNHRDGIPEFLVELTYQCLLKRRIFRIECLALALFYYFFLIRFGLCLIERADTCLLYTSDAADE